MLIDKRVSATSVDKNIVDFIEERPIVPSFAWQGGFEWGGGGGGRGGANSIVSNKLGLLSSLKIIFIPWPFFNINFSLCQIFSSVHSDIFGYSNKLLGKVR
jgi:hypothetical protein